MNPESRIFLCGNCSFPATKHIVVGITIKAHPVKALPIKAPSVEDLSFGLLLTGGAQTKEP